MGVQRLFTSSIVCAVVFAAVAVACSSESETEPAASAAPGSNGTASEVLDFTAPKLGGGTVEGMSYAGQDVAIWFWAPW